MSCGSETASVTKTTETHLRKWKILTAVGLGLGLFAVAMSIVSLTLLIVLRNEQPAAAAVIQTTTEGEESRHNTRESTYETQPLRTNEENELLVADIVHKKHFHGERNKRFASCLDYSDKQKNKTPTAHITGTDNYQNYIFKDNQVEIVSDEWLCNNKYTRAHVAGGMTFIDGFLKVPYDGVYFIYSQVSMEVKNSTQNDSKPPVVMGHNTMICECSDKEELDKSCKCYTEESNSQKQLSSLKNRLYLQSESQSIGAIKGTHFHGGLFHLTANSYISIVPVISKDSIDNDSASTKVYARFVNSFYGAFLVSK